MALFPKIQSPCPYQSNLAAVMDGDMCRMCKRHVVDLTAMSDAARVAFLDGCTGEVCVSYRIRPALAAAVLAAAIAVPATASACAATEEFIVVAGGLKDLTAIEYVETTSDRALPNLPVVYDDDAKPQVATTVDTPIKAPGAT